MLTLCDALRALTASCSSGREDAAAREDPARAKELALLRAGAGASGHAAALPQALRRSVRLRAGSQRGAALEDAVGFELEPSGRPDFRASVAAVATDGAAAAAGVKPDALLIAIDGRSTRGWSLQQVRGALQRAVVPSALSAYALASSGYTDFQASDVMVEFAQYIEAANVAPKSMDKNPYALTHFPSPQGEQLPGVNRFLEGSEQERAVPAASEEECEASALPLHRRERSRSFKHFWMSDRSSKACYECEQLFTFFRRRHHCRSCGQLFCSNCCARLPQSFGGNKVDDSIARLRKQLVCHTCHLQLREGLHMKLTGATFETEGVAKSSDSSTSQTLLLMPQHITEALERSSSDTAQWKHVDKSELFDRDEISSDPRPSDQPDKSNMAPVLFTMFPKVQIKASVQHLAHQPHLHELGKDTKQRGRVVETRPRALSETVIVPMREHIRKEAYSRSFNKLKRCNSSSYIGNPSIHRWSEAEFKRLVAQSHAEARIAGTFPSSSKSVASNRPKALSANFDTTHFGNSVNIDPFGVGSSNGTGGSSVERLRNNTLTNYAESERIAIKDSKILSVIGLSDDACDAMKDPEWRRRKEDVLQEMAQHAQTRLEERIFHMLEHSSEISRLFMVEQHRWMQIINLFTNRAATQVSCEPDRGDTMDIMEYVRVQCLEGGRVQDSFFIDGVMVHKSLARKGMRSDILKPRILLLATALDYQRKKEAISSLESVAGQEVEYMHIVTEKILTLRPDIVMFEGHVHRVAEELLFKENVALVKNVRLIDLQRIARCTGASILTSYDHIDKMSDKGIIGTCARFYVMISDQAPKSAKRISYKMSSPSMAQHVVKPLPPNGTDSDRWSTSSTTSAGTDPRPHRRRRVQRQNIVFEGGQSSKGCTLCLRGGSPEVFSEVTEILGATIRAAYNMRLQRAILAEYGYVPPPEQLERSVAEEWFAKCSTSLYISLKSNSLSMRAALKETQSMCKWCKAHTRYNNISSLRVLSTNRDRENGEATGSVLGGGVEMNQCTCGSKASYTLRDRILFSTCWSTIEGKSASKAELMCIDFYSSNDISLGQFFDKFCFDGSKSEFKRAFTTCKLSFSHDTGRITFRVKDLSAIKDQNEKLMPAADLLRDINHRAVLRLVRSDKLVLWSRNIADENNPTSTSNPLSVQYSILPRDVRNYSFGKFLEDLFYGKAMSIDVNRFPHLAGVIGSRDPSLVRFFSCRGRVVSVQFEPLEPVLHVALQPALWQDHVDHEQQLVAVHELCELAREVYVVTTSKIAESMADPVTAFHAKHNLKILRNEVQQWYSCFASKLESNPPQHVFEHNAHFKQIYDYGVRWSLRITQAVQATVRPTLKDQTNSPKSTLPRAWFNQLPQSANLVGQSPFVPAPTSTSSTIDVQEPGNLENLASFARSLAQARLNGNSTPVGFSHVANEVSNTLRRRNGNVLPELAEAWSMEENFDAYDETSRSFPNESLDSESLSGNLSVFPRAASTIGSLGSKKALESFRRMRQQKGDELGYLKLPKRLLAWHPSLPSGINNKVVLVNASQPTSVVAYSLYSKEYAKCVNDYIRREASNAAATSTTSVSSDPDDEVTRSMLRILRAPARTNVDHSFADENQFQAATTRFSCKSYYAMQFHALRHLYYGGDRNYVESLCECQQWNAAGGKSGAGFLKTRDERFIAKAIPEIELQMFLSMANEYFSYMAKTFENDLSSMLSKVLGIYKVSILQGDHEQKMCVVVMENLLYGREVNFSFDLKGKMEGRYKDVDAGDSRPVLWDRNFVEMAGGIPLPLQESAMSLLLSAIMNDTGFLASVQATDYSMLVGYDVNKQEIVASIIDYIHKYDFMKMMEHAGKRLIQEEGEITVLNPKHYRKRFCRAMTRYFVTIPSRYTKVTTVSSSRTAMNGLPPIAGSGYGSGFGMVMNSSVGSTGTVTNTAGEDDRDDSSQYGYWSGLNSALSTPMNAAADFSRNGRTW